MSSIYFSWRSTIKKKKAAERLSLPPNGVLNSSLKERCPPFTQIDLDYERSRFNQTTSLGAQLCLVHITAYSITTLPQLVHEPLKRLLRKLLNCCPPYAICFSKPLQSTGSLELCPHPRHRKVKEGHSLGNSKNGASVSEERRQECHDPMWVMSISFLMGNRQWGFVVSFEKRS